jgi:NAD(P)-dependent dehydrogenase (short-subunit alcohol dehydrogenase family)
MLGERNVDLAISGLRVLVTAGAAGIGLEIARAFLREGARVHVCDVDAARLSGLKASDPDLTSSPCDVSDRGQVAGLFDETLATLGGLDTLINNAGIAGPTGRVEEIAPEDWDRTLAVNITGQFNCARLAVPHLRRSGNPSMVNLSSAAGKFSFPLRAPYSASKFAVIGFTRTLARELGPDGIRVNAILPGTVEGPRIQSVFENKARESGTSADEIRRRALSVVSLGRMIAPQDIANLAVFLASPLGANISGQELSVDADAQMLV